MTLDKRSHFIFRRVILFLGDSALFYLALLLTLAIRYGESRELAFTTHWLPFTIGFAAWLIIAYVGGLYELDVLKNSREFRNLLGGLIASETIFLILLFYLVPAFDIAPKTNLAIFIALFITLLFVWRYLANALFITKVARVRLMLLGSNASIEEVAKHIDANPQLGYEVGIWLKDGLQNKNSRDLEQFVREKEIGLIVVPGHIKKQARSAKIAYQRLINGTRVMSLADFYQQLFRRISLVELEEVWFLDNLALRRRSYQLLKHLIESLAGFILLILLLPVLVLIGLLIKITSAGPILYIQRRVGQGGKTFNLYKFRSMYGTVDKNPDANAATPTWSSGEKDRRVTPLGKILRRTHLDEFPQLYNILIGDMSFVGPRPERPEFDTELEQDIPFYELRYLVKPGITGWAQINYPYGASVEDAYQKVQYDIYYLTHRSPILDALIILKTLKRFFVQAK